MLQTTTMPLSKGSLHSCTFKRIPDETRFHVVDPNVIQKVESSGKYYVSIESFRETFAKIKKKILEIVASIWKRIKEAYRKYFGAYTSLIKRGNELATRADNTRPFKSVGTKRI